MAQFRFQYQTVLRQREMVEEQAQRRLAQVLRQRMILRDQLTKMQQTTTTSKQQLRDSLQGRVNLDSISTFARYSGQVMVRAQQIVRELAGLEQRIGVAQAELLAATRARKALELLQERQRERWRRQEELRETAELDDLAQQAFLRQRAMELEV